jgi:hypothetical protein
MCTRSGSIHTDATLWLSTAAAAELGRAYVAVDPDSLQTATHATHASQRSQASSESHQAHAGMLWAGRRSNLNSAAHPGPEALGRGQRAPDIARAHARGQPVGGVVGALQHLLTRRARIALGTATQCTRTNAWQLRLLLLTPICGGTDTRARKACAGRRADDGGGVGVMALAHAGPDSAGTRLPPPWRKT